MTSMAAMDGFIMTTSFPRRVYHVSGITEKTGTVLAIELSAYTIIGAGRPGMCGTFFSAIQGIAID
jgi:hypothetical protein